MFTLVQVCVHGVLHYCAFTKTGASLMMTTNQIAELNQKIPAFSNTVNKMTGTKQ